MNLYNDPYRHGRKGVNMIPLFRHDDNMLTSFLIHCSGSHRLDVSRRSAREISTVV